ncbi:GNAT family N-acetyltransferase [Nereida sp. MMG025]|uniref:GNAT family N-acetyltransferase n=1 Tax=Nereida sp. MMG025 TaxID=2909981 RepID=UPI001EFF7165|nr:GNAT family N-acetyltransferase [Nereida sp. MMG025]MCF6445529.1 GNAT family N-acetyltransferase [Nereida sp. MMG025]
MRTPISTQLAATHSAAFDVPRPWTAKEIDDLLAQSGMHLVGDATCFAIARTVVDETELLTIATHPDHQKQGHARRVLHRLFELAHRSGSRQIFLEVASTNAPAIGLYHAIGFSTVGMRPRYYQTPERQWIDAIVMTRALPVKSR